MIIGIDARPLAQKKLTGTAEYTLGVLSSLLEIDDKNQYRLFFNSFSAVDLPDFGRDDVRVISSRIPNKIFNVPLQKILSYPKIDKKLQADVFFQPNIGFLALSAKVKKVLTIHDLSFLRYPQFFSNKMRLWHYLVDVKKQAKHANKIIAVSENTKRDIIELLNVEEEKIKVIYSGIDSELTSTKDQNIDKINDIKSKYGLPEKFFLSFSTLEPRKNIEGTIKAFDIYVKKTGDRKTHLVIAGTQGWKYSKILDAHCQSDNKSLIKLIGYVEAEDKKYIYSLAKALVFVSFYEGFGFPPLEALACACPVILSANSSLLEIAGSNSIIVNPLKINELVSALELVQMQKGNHEERQKNAQIIKDKFNWHDSARKHLDVFMSLE